MNRFMKKFVTAALAASMVLSTAVMASAAEKKHVFKITYNTTGYTDTQRTETASLSNKYDKTSELSSKALPDSAISGTTSEQKTFAVLSGGALPMGWEVGSTLIKWKTTKWSDLNINDFTDKKESKDVTTYTTNASLKFSTKIKADSTGAGAVKISSAVLDATTPTVTLSRKSLKDKDGDMGDFQGWEVTAEGVNSGDKMSKLLIALGLTPGWNVSAEGVATKSSSDTSITVNVLADDATYNDGSSDVALPSITILGKFSGEMEAKKRDEGDDDRYYPLTAKAGEGGKISDEGVTVVKPGKYSKTYTVTPDAGYEVAWVKVDGRYTQLNADLSYTFTGMFGPRSIEVGFKPVESK